MNTISRQIEAKIKQRLEEPNPLIQVVIGPRQVGKTTALKRALDGRGHYETADSPVAPSHINIADWWAKGKAAGCILAIDEIQKITGWSEVVKKLWDQDPIKLILTGSSALQIEKGLRESLAGRFELLRVGHWTFGEAQAAFGFDLYKYIEFGCYPGSVHLMEDVGRWAAYVRDSIVETVIGRDLLTLHPVENPALLRQVFGVAVGMPSSVISLQKIMGQLQKKGSIPTIQSYLHLLSHAFLVTPLYCYKANAVRERSSSPKLIVHDNALIRAFLRPVHKKLGSDLLGFYFENTVGARLIESGWDVFYWKDRNDEVDFVALGPNGEKWAIEVKSGGVSEDELAGLKRFCKEYPSFEPCLVSLKDHRFKGVRSIPPDEILNLEPQY